MALYRNVRPLLMDSESDRDTALERAEAHLKRRGIVQPGDVYAITCGEPMGAPGGTNMLKICRLMMSHRSKSVRFADDIRPTGKIRVGYEAVTGRR